jgi:aspartate 1-decarboxylase
MLRSICKSKIHRATVTRADIDYEGSITIDRTLMDAVDLIPYEEVWIYDVTNGSRLQTYVIEGEADSGTIGINGAAAKLVSRGDLVIIAAFAMMDDARAKAYVPKHILVDENNRVVKDLLPRYGELKKMSAVR